MVSELDTFCQPTQESSLAFNREHIPSTFDAREADLREITRIESAAYENKPEQEEGLFTVVTANGTFPRKLTFDEVQCVSGGATSLKQLYHS